MMNDRNDVNDLEDACYGCGAPSGEPCTDDCPDLAADLREWADWNKQQFSLTLRQWIEVSVK